MEEEVKQEQTNQEINHEQEVQPEPEAKQGAAEVIETPAEVQPEPEKLKKPEKAKKSKKQKPSDENLTEDELYAKIQTEKLLKKRQTKKIGTFVALCVAMALAVCIIVLAAVPVSLKPRCVKSDFDEVSLIVGDIADRHYEKGDEKYDEFVSYFNKAFSQPYLSALFSGSLFDYQIEENYDALNNNAREVIRNRVGKSSNLVQLSYRTQQVITLQNGKKYEPTKANTDKLTFKDVYFVVEKDAGVKQVAIYFVANYPHYTDGQLDDLPNYRLVTITVRADTSVIYNAWATLTNE